MNDSQEASGYFRSTLLLQFQSQEPSGAAVAWNVSSDVPGTAVHPAADGLVHITRPIEIQAPAPAE